MCASRRARDLAGVSSASAVWPRRVRRALVWTGWLGVLALAVAYADVTWRYRDRIVPPEAVDPAAGRVAVVFGAAVYPNGHPSPILADRVRTAVALYRAGRVSKLLLSGDNRFENYNEPAAMAELARQYGVPDDVLVLDYAGRRTYDTCWRARHIFGLRRVVLVTQRFHLPRALYLCQALGLDALGVPADRPTGYRGQWWYGGVREAVARVRAWADVHLWTPSVVGGAPIRVEKPTSNSAP